MIEAVAIAVAGAFIGQLTDVIDLRKTEDNLKRLQAPGLWIAVAFKMLAAALLMWVYLAAGEHPGPLLSLSTGLSADVIIKGLTKAASTQPLPGSSDRSRKRLK